jgi:hypothetical protein
MKKTLKLNPKEIRILLEITEILPTTTIGILEQMIAFRESLKIAGSQEESEFEISEKLAATITNGMQQMSGFSPDIDILNVFKQLEAIHGKADS